MRGVVDKGADFVHRAEEDSKRIASAAREKVESAGDAVKEVVGEGKRILQKAKVKGQQLVDSAKEEGTELLRRTEREVVARAHRIEGRVVQQADTLKETMEGFQWWLQRSLAPFTLKTERQVPEAAYLPLREVGGKLGRDSYLASDALWRGFSFWG